MSEARTRPSLFQDDPSPAPAVDLGRFAAKPALAADAPAADTIRRISDEGGFPSRAPTTAKPADADRTHAAKAGPLQERPHGHAECTPDAARARPVP